MSLFGATAQPAATSTSSMFGGQQQQAQQQMQQQQMQQQQMQHQQMQQQQMQHQQMQQQQQQQMQQQQQQQQQQAALLQQSQLGGSIWKPGSLSTHQKSIPEQMQAITNKWDPSNPACEFRTYFYNKVDESHIPFYGPAPGDDPKAWEAALADKPAAGFIPVAAVGFQALAQRLNAQRLAVGQFNQRLHEINASLDAILSRHDLETSVRSLAARRRHAELRRRSLALAARVQVLRNRGYALSGDEDDLGAKLAALERSAQDPALAARMEELWSRLITLRDYAESLQAEIGKGALNADQGGLGDEVEAKAKKILEDYEKQIQHLKKELELVKKDFDEWEKQSTPVSKS
ncbi:hypothetical protein GGTG_12020 [Gaeumannomyces tritici R3-111a-1]|uniref:Nucleoporin Nup54 alpha-helical domain-containing protein n=1 Tax=Gaeumannomyces tritici (strain R3-111a-1) TaxID=644352 RepID=J3PEU1_GAET3|nr:hypothetical protein GGTG_12020 [Gaeumannomyces tritici R3-111a-1]EJT70999.1 hypothetical protein GGTG_12020 [Gaeumannomyces tritici R3-111a-1]